VSDTPRTDSARHDEHDPYTAIASECSKLERELNAANAKIKRLDNHIERLESIGDSLFDGVTRVEAEQRWRKAKEAKP
jgi:peptidoglycan hydrolase CwlO-like protein